MAVFPPWQVIEDRFQLFQPRRMGSERSRKGFKGVNKNHLPLVYGMPCGKYAPPLLAGLYYAYYPGLGGT